MNFNTIKRDVTETFIRLKEIFLSLKQQIGNINEKNFILIESKILEDGDEIREISDNLEINFDMITRNKMKCVFFGKTSNGKSATINAILGAEVLPSNIGRTTSCFITVEGSNENSGYLLDSNGNKRLIGDINDLANELDDHGQDINHEIKLFWPISRCEFLQSEVKLLDSPGVDYSPRNNKWIETFCRDADIFVYVVDGGSTINESERVFFRRVKYLLKTPNIMIVMNKWDQCSDTKSPSEIEKLKQQHQETARSFMCDDLKLPFDANKQLFFISATQALECSVSRESGANIGPFMEFVRILQDELSEKATVTKFKPHVLKGGEYIDISLTILDKIISTSRNEFTRTLPSKLQLTIKGLVKTTFERIRSISTAGIETQLHLLGQSITKGDGADYNDKMASESAEKFIVKVLQDTFKENIGELCGNIREEFIKYCRYSIPDAALEQYIPPIFDEYVSMFEKELPRQVFCASSRLKMSCGNTGPKTENSMISLLSTWIPVITNVMIHKNPKDAPIAMAIGKGLEDTLNEKKKTDNKNEAKEIPDYYLKSMITSSIMQFVNQTEIDLANGAKEATVQFIEDADEVNDNLKSLDKIKKTLLDIKVILKNIEKNLE